MKSRALPILNAIGCLALTGVVVAQWRKERTLDSALVAMGSELASARAQSAEDSKRRTALERDITLLKESIEATQVAAEASARTLVEHDQAASLLKEKLAAASAQVAVWETAIKTRDARIRSLNEDLAAARQRLDQAIAKLKAAGQSNKQ